MASQRAAGARFRQKKLSTKHALPILREDNAADFDVEAQRHIPLVETGVEKAEEIEHHLQAVISSQAAGSGAVAFIPTPPTNLSSVQFERLYSSTYKHPVSYIRFSSTVEDTSGPQYCIDLEDSIYLVNLNAGYKKSNKGPGPCTEDQFEEVMSFFEETSSLKQPYATLDNTPVLVYSEMESSFDDTIDESSRVFAKDIYEHWKKRRSETQNHPLMPAVKFERNADTDESDPFVCFRRRETRQARKTRGRDAQVVERLKKLRTELEQARQLMHLAKQREHGRRDQILLDKQIFENRCAVKEIKRNLGIKGDDQDLFNQRPVEKAPKADPAIVRMPGMVPKVPLRPEGRVQDQDLQLLTEDRSKREAEVNTIIQESMAKHRTWNNGWVDNTWRPITPPLETGIKPSFRAAVTEFLPTPPSSDDGEQAREAPLGDRFKSAEDRGDTPFRYDSPPLETPQPRPSFRRRVGRGGRMWIDRRGLTRPDMSEDAMDVDDQDADKIAERNEYDIASDDEHDILVTDPYDMWNLRYRINYLVPLVRDPETLRKMEEHQRRQQALAATAAASLANGNRPLGLSGSSPTQAQQKADAAAAK